MLISNSLGHKNINFALYPSLALTICFLFLSIGKGYGQQSLAEKLGYNKDAKLLIIHADDLGISHSENVASIKAMEEGTVNSASIMMPTPWVTEIADYAKSNNDKHDLGLHLVLTSEWENYKWGPVASKEKIPSLIDDHGYFYADCLTNPNLDEVETELRAQIELAYTMGINPTHLDSHMGCLFWTKVEVFKIYIKLAQEYELPCLVDRSFANLFTDKNEFDEFLKDQDINVLVDYNLTISPSEYKEGPAIYYKNALRSIQPGLTQLLIHTAYDNDEMQAITINHPDWGATWRQDDFDFFMSDICKKIIEEEEIILVTWREISKALSQ